MKPTLAVFLHGHRYDRLAQAVSILLTASSMGWPTHLFLFYGALASFVAGTWDEINVADPADGGPQPEWLARMARGFEQGNPASLYDMLGKAAEEPGGLTIYACSASCKVMGLDVKTVRERVDEVVGLPTMMQIAGRATHVMYI